MQTVFVVSYLYQYELTVLGARSTLAAAQELAEQHLYANGRTPVDPEWRQESPAEHELADAPSLLRQWTRCAHLQLLPGFPMEASYVVQEFPIEGKEAR